LQVLTGTDCPALTARFQSNFIIDCFSQPLFATKIRFAGSYADVGYLSEGRGKWKIRFSPMKFPKKRQAMSASVDTAATGTSQISMFAATV
jgi:hypothetical protein